ncbi:hypothetical protein LJC58_05910 [Lachnospiraceae bacterium OttesenSCG-928-D06]|nr:hypothetical protein [Lachnospiraceae bacterium OttesenSCG-928-D06]
MYDFNTEKMPDLKTEDSGSAVIEAVVSLTVFIVAIITVLSFINICRAQAMISNAVDSVAKEMSQYAYFYHISGLEGLEKNILEKTKEDRKRLNSIVDATESLYAVFDQLSGDVGTTDINTIINNVLSGSSNTNGIENIISSSVTGKTASLANDIDKLTSVMSSVDNPLGFLKSVLTIVGLEGASIAKSRLIAAPLSKVLIKKHFEVDDMDADTYLRTFNIDGLDAINFNMSTIFAPTTPDDIHIVAYYQIKVVDFFNFDFGKVTLCKESVTRAWLGGDDSN